MSRFPDLMLPMLNPASHDENDERLMRAKMNFLGTRLEFHPNVVNFIGALPEGDVGMSLALPVCHCLLIDGM